MHTFHDSTIAELDRDFFQGYSSDIMWDGQLPGLPAGTLPIHSETPLAVLRPSVETPSFDGDEETVPWRPLGSCGESFRRAGLLYEDNYSSPGYLSSGSWSICSSDGLSPGLSKANAAFGTPGGTTYSLEELSGSYSDSSRSTSSAYDPNSGYFPDGSYRLRQDEDSLDYSLFPSRRLHFLDF